MTSLFGSSTAEVVESEGTRKSALLPRSFHEKPLTIVRAVGMHLVTNDGRKILDASSGAAVSSIGPAPNQRVEKAITRQRQNISYLCTYSFTSEIAQKYARSLLATTHGNFEYVGFYDSGSAAVEAAAKLALQYWKERGRNKCIFITRLRSYHGATLGALSFSGHEARREPFRSGLVENVSHVSPCNSYRDKAGDETDAAYVDRLKDELHKEINRLGSENVAAFMVEPTVGAALGAMPSVPGYLKAMREVCDYHDVLFIFDEVMCGMGRSGTLHAWEQEDAVPDIQVLGKGISGGFEELSAVFLSKEIADAIAAGSGYFNHGHTFQNWAPGCAAGLEILEMVQEKNLPQNANEQGKLLLRLLKEAVGGHEYVGDVRGKGLLIGIEIVSNKSTKEPFESSDLVAHKIHKRGLEDPHNIHVYPGTGSATGKTGDHLIIAPPLDITEQSVQEIVDRVKCLIHDFFAAFMPTLKLSAGVGESQKQALHGGDEAEVSECDKSTDGEHGEGSVSIAEEDEKRRYIEVDYIWRDMEGRLKATSTVEGKYNRFGFLVKRVFTRDKKYLRTNIVINNKELREVVLAIMADVKGISHVDHRSEVDDSILFLYLEQIRQHSMSLVLGSDAAELCGKLIKYLDEAYAATRQRLTAMTKAGIISFDLVWALFKPGVIALTSIPGAQEEYQCFRVDYIHKQKEHGRLRGTHSIKWLIGGHVLAIDGSRYSYNDVQVTIDKFEGARQISKMRTYPLDYAANAASKRETLLQRGKAFVLLQFKTQYSYHGMAMERKDDDVTWIPVEGPIIVDPSGYRKYNSENAMTILNDINLEDHNFEEEEYVIASPLVGGFSMKQARWVEFLVRYIEEYDWPVKAFDRLILDESTKLSILALVSNNMEHPKNMDFVEGKGRGVTILLHGPPGCGKTLTAEAVAAKLRAPLYMVSAGELGDAKDMMGELSTIFGLVRSWNGIIMVDDVDHLLQKHRSGDVKRSSSMSVFLRALEYYSGVVVMATTRVEQLDEAIHGRIHLCILYQPLGRESRESLWKTFIEDLVDGDHDVQPEHWKSWAAKDLSGRQIKTTIQIAEAFARTDHERLSQAHVAKAITQIESNSNISPTQSIINKSLYT